MCKITRVRVSDKNAYIDIEDEILFAVKKMPIDKFRYAEKFGNADFIERISIDTTDRDFNDACNAHEISSILCVG